ncbi:MAG: acyl-ACP--UDP-N-acetylglucosamine O-acyltransferase [Candidatus Omnitrophica bacterium]|nr:acyl-ACP--UDP-N-acetylglucosamine O-acyltransferase [Candidatus Omnitrophota bacterium]
MSIHPTAVINPNAEIADDVEVGPYAVIEDNVKIGPRVNIMARAYICRYTEIDEETEIHMGGVIGHLPQDLAFRKKRSFLKIGKRNIIREYATIHRGTQEDSETRIGDDNFIMGFVHIGHNCRIGNNVTIANATTLAGYVELDNRVFISAHVVVHQFVRIGTLSMIGGKSRITKDVLPYMLVNGNSTVYGLNIVGLRRAQFSAETRNRIKMAHKIIYKSGYTLAKATEELEKAALGEEVRRLIDFLKAGSKRGYCGHV